MFWNRVAVLKLLAVGRVLVARAYRGRTFVKIDHALFDRVSAALDKVTAQQPVGIHETAELIVCDFMAANRTDDDARAALIDWIADAIYLTTLDLSETADNLRHAAQRVIDNWESGDLAGAVRDLSALLCRDETSCVRSTPSVTIPANSPAMYNSGQALASCSVGGQ
ncbi:hypothetical protein PLCT2_02297 [Planctomycetaceae bacterium]|nr:hypothetical protein PLCT2_02297 [Planctomycetaceae bacterium]